MLNDEQRRRLRRAALKGRNRLAQAMVLAELTQVDLADAIGITQAHVSTLVRGNYKDLPLETSRAIAKYFGCAIEELFPDVDAEVA